MYFKRIKPMKNKLFLALALAGAVACKKDKPAEPSNNDVNAQVTNFINKLDLTKDLAIQVKEFASTLKNDTEMENILVGKARANSVWELEKFTGTTHTTQMDTIEKRTFSWDTKNPYDAKGTKKITYDQVDDFIKTTIEFEEAKTYGFVPNENNAAIEEQGVYYLSNGVIVLSNTKLCAILSENNTNNYFVAGLIVGAYEGINLTISNETSNQITAQFPSSQKNCYNSFSMNTYVFSIDKNNPNNFTMKSMKEYDVTMLFKESAPSIKQFYTKLTEINMSVIYKK